MPALKPTEITGRVVWLGVVPDRAAALASDPVETMRLTYAGPEGEDHGGLTRPSCSRVLSQYPTRGTEIRNARQLAIVSAEELAEIAADIGVAQFDPRWIGATMVIEGIPDFTHIPPSSRLQAPSGATITIDMENRPCVLPGPVINKDAPGAGQKFKTAAKGKRGVTAWVERVGDIALGDELTLHVPDQRAWKG